MLKTSNKNIMNEIVCEIEDDRLCMTLVREDDLNGSDNVFNFLAGRMKYPNPIFGHKDANPFVVLPVYYHLNESAAYERNKAISELFNRWTKAGLNKRHAKNPFKSKEFVEYLDEIELTKSDYVILGL